MLHECYLFLLGYVEVGQVRVARAESTWNVVDQIRDDEQVIQEVTLSRQT